MPEKNATQDHMPAELVSWLENSSPESYFRVNLKVLATELQLPFQQLLSAFVRLTHEGKFNLSWEFHCPQCNGIPGFRHRFGELKSENYCGVCDLSFRNTLDKNIEVTFTAHPSFRTIPPLVRESFEQQMLEAVKAQRYHMPSKYVSGLECLNNETFRELFGDDVLSTQESLAVETMTFLFTDIKGSTQMYSDLGDARSYQIVREHFKILFAAVERHGGIVVKTIGDAVMASFLNPADALQAASEAQHEFSGRSWEKAGYLSIKMGMHTGSAIVVNLNNAVDYFGNTVNLAARVQGSVEDHSIRFTKRVLEDPAVNAVLRARRAKLSHRVMSFKGISGEVDVYTMADF